MYNFLFVNNVFFETFNRKTAEINSVIKMDDYQQLMNLKHCKVFLITCHENRSVSTH